MTIGFDGSRAFSRSRTGTENYAYQLLKALSKIDTENKYLIYLRGGVKTNDNWPKNFIFKRINLPRLWTQLGLAACTFTDSLDLLFIPSHTLPLIRKPGLNTVMTVHDLGSEYLPGMHQIKQRLYLDFITRFQLKTATKLIAVSKSTKLDLVKKVGIEAKKVEVIYEGINNFHAVNDDIERAVLKSLDIERKKYFLFVGTVQPRKNLIRLIKAYKGFLEIMENYHPRTTRFAKASARQANYKLVIAGSKGWLSEDIYALPKKIGLEKDVLFTGRVNDAELAVLYKNTLALTYPSLFEGFGLPILEAYSAGIPVLTSNISSMPEVAGKGAILVRPDQTTDIIGAMIKLATDSKLRDNLVKEGKKQLEKFSWEKCARETLKVFKEYHNLFMNSIKILGVRVDKITKAQSIEQIKQWLSEDKKRYIVTPNIEFVMLAQTDKRFITILNDADLCIPDSARFGWAKFIISQKFWPIKITAWPLFLFPKIFRFPVTTGTDLMGSLIAESQEKGFTIGFLGGKNEVAERLKECLTKKYKKIRINFASSDIVVNSSGQVTSKPPMIPKLDLLFVALGHGKQEKWIADNLNRLDVKIMMGVGGAFEYLSGEVPRAPGLIRSLGFEWLYRLIIEPWRIKRFGSLLKFIFKILVAN